MLKSPNVPDNNADILVRLLLSRRMSLIALIFHCLFTRSHFSLYQIRLFLNIWIVESLRIAICYITCVSNAG